MGCVKPDERCEIILPYIDSVIEHVLDIAVFTQRRRCLVQILSRFYTSVSVQGHGPDASPTREPQKSEPH
jgi:hypothetical protein